LPTIEFFDRIKSEKILIVTSEVLEAELENAPLHVRGLLTTLPTNQIVRTEVTEEVGKLVRAYIERNVAEKQAMQIVFI